MQASIPEETYVLHKLPQNNLKQHIAIYMMESFLSGFWSLKQHKKTITLDIVTYLYW